MHVPIQRAAHRAKARRVIRADGRLNNCHCCPTGQPATHTTLLHHPCPIWMPLHRRMPSAANGNPHQLRSSLSHEAWPLLSLPPRQGGFACFLLLFVCFLIRSSVHYQSLLPCCISRSVVQLLHCWPSHRVNVLFSISRVVRLDFTQH